MENRNLRSLPLFRNISESDIDHLVSQVRIRSKIFDYFFSKDHSLGTGLGLNRVYNLVTFLLDGKLNLESHPGKGTKIIVSWHKNL